MLEKKQINQILESDVSKSQKMRSLYEGGLEIGEIAKLMGVRYNFVYNVVSDSYRKAGIEMRTRKTGDSVKSQIVSFIKEGLNPVEISKTLKCNINMVYKYRKEMELGLIE